MNIKVGDIINIFGCEQRVTKMGHYYITLSRNGVFSLDEIRYLINTSTDIESVTLPQLDVGDLVFVDNITNDEKSRYGSGWYPEKDKYIGKIWPVTNIKNTEFFGSLVTLGDGQDFQIYHLEKISDYDIV